jgi:alkanesulfonate monooxygenase SsuD/methylene tetrahydromethanopterin reductase-like flavin-dependent oxidoreductase (luciferase family)
MVMRYGYKASAEQFAPRELIDYSVLAEQLGLETIAISDHFQPAPVRRLTRPLRRRRRGREPSSDG